MRAAPRRPRYRILHSSFLTPAAPHPSAESYRTVELAQLGLERRGCPRSCRVVQETRPSRLLAKLVDVFLVNRKEQVK